MKSFSSTGGRIARWAKRLLYYSGALSVYHRLHNRRRLTVVLFHRVLSESDARWPLAEPTWTLPERVFGECLRFFTRHYQVISLQDLVASCQGLAQLPRRALLVTFDDGWSDNEEYALRLLQRERVPAVVFVTAGAVGQADMWEETVWRAWQEGTLRPSDCGQLWDTAAQGLSAKPTSWETESAIWSLIGQLATLDRATRKSLLARVAIVPGGGARRHMVSREQIGALAHAGVAVASHGFTHMPISQTADPAGELQRSRSTLAEILQRPDGEGPVALSFPHGRYDSAILQEAAASGYRLLFTSDPHLNIVAGSEFWPRVFGRVHIPVHEVTDSQGRFCPELLAFWLFRRPARRV